MFDDYEVDMLLKGVSPCQKWMYVRRIKPWHDLMHTYPQFWRGVLKCTDSYEELLRRSAMPLCQANSHCVHDDLNHYRQFSHCHDHITNIVLEMHAYNEALDAIGDVKLKRCTCP